MPWPFLTADWNNLFLVSYAVPPSLLEKRLPPGLRLDLRDGQAFVSLVAFEFLNTRVLRVGWPGFRHFGEINLRFYVRHGEERGVVFIRELVPQRLVAWVANRLYNEPYVAAPIVASRLDLPDRVTMNYRLTYAGRDHHIRATGDKPAFRPEEGSLEHFFKEHKWGFGVTRRGQALRYEVEHPVWDCYPLREYTLDFDFAAVYGPEWGFLAREKPYSAVLAAGSGVKVFPKGRL